MTAFEDARHFRKLSETEAVALRLDPDSRAADCPLDWPGDAIRVAVLDADRGTNHGFWERNLTGAERAVLAAAPDADAAACNLKALWHGMGLTAARAALADGGRYVDLAIAMDADRYGDARAFAKHALEPWWDGDVYMLERLRRVVWTSDDGRTREEWETVDCVCNVYLGDDDDWVAYARETFGIAG